MLTTFAYVLLLAPGAEAVDLGAWEKIPGDFKGVTLAGGKAEMTALPWSFLRSKDEHAHCALTATVTVVEPAKRADFFGSSWSVWPDATFGDQGYEAALLLRAGEGSGYRVQLSHRYQCLTLTKYPGGGFVRSVPCAIKLKTPLTVRAAAQGNHVVVSVDGKEVLDFRDDLLPLGKGHVGVGTSSEGKVVFSDVRLEALEARPPTPAVPHQPRFAVRKWHGGRPWVFDGDEPILLCPTPDASYINNVKLRPGYKPQLSWNSHWDISNQGAYPEGASKNDEVRVAGGGRSLRLSWTARQLKGRFATRSTLTVGFNPSRGTYAYDVDSELEVRGAPFHFRYGYDFEHHTPLDPFRWQYLVVRRDDGGLVRRPVYPIDPGVLEGVAQERGLRLWFGRVGEQMLVAPAVEYDIPDPGKRKMNTAVCAAFYDTGVAFVPEEAGAGTKVRVRYRYTGYPADEARGLFERSRTYAVPMLDPKRHYVFADAWPRLRFERFLPLDEPWWGGRPFLSGHNVPPQYDLVRKTPHGNALSFGPSSHAVASLPAPGPLGKGRYAVTAWAKSVGTHGPGGWIEVLAVDQAHENGYVRMVAKVLKEERHYLGNGSFDWKRVGFLTEVPSGAPAVALGLGNAGTGEVLFADVAVRPLAEGSAVPEGVADRPRPEPALPPAPAGAIADYRMEEGRGLYVFDHARGPLGNLELANVGWTTAEGRPALRFADNTAGRKDYPRGGVLDRAYLSHPSYQGRDTVPVAVAGLHGGGSTYKAFTVALWVKPAAKMAASHSGTADLAGFAARRVKLSLRGEAPYTLGANLSYTDYLWSDARLEANRWYHVALTGEEAGGKWKLRLYLDGKKVHEATSEKVAAPAEMPSSLVLGTEIFYFHDAYYRGLIGRTLVFNRALPADEIVKLATR